MNPQSPAPTVPKQDEVALFIEGTPVQQGSKTAYVVGKRAVVTDQNKVTLKPWRALVAGAADVGVTFNCPVEVTLAFNLPRPQRPKFWAPAVKPDADKLARALLDGLTDGGLLEDDARVVDLHVSERYALPVGVAVTVREATA